MSRVTKILIGIIVLLVIAVGATGYMLISGDKIHSNITVEGIDVSRMSKEEAAVKVKTTIDSSIEKLKLSCVFRDKTWELDYKTLDYKYDISKTIDAAYAVGRKGSYFKRVIDVINSQFNPNSFNIDYSYDENGIKSFLSELTKEIDQEMVDATITFKKPTFTVTEHVEGRKLNTDKAFDIIKEEIDNKSSSIIEMPVEIIVPMIKKSDLDGIKDVLGEFSTKFNSADTDRTHNINVATNSASNILLHPGEIYSVNQVVGPRLEKFGFKEAKVIINNELVPGIGGGVCQVSSTLYNAVLLSNLKIVERRNHSLPLSYISVGRDATISGDYIDFKFMNSTSYPIYVYGEVVGSWVKFYVYGRNDNPNRTVKIDTEIVSTTEPTIEVIPDPTLPEGTEVEEKKAYTGYVVKSYRSVFENGSLINRELLFTDKYKVVNGVKRVGTQRTNTFPGDGMTGEQEYINGVN